jgi:hypothetical protein
MKQRWKKFSPIQEKIDLVEKDHESPLDERQADAI